jgi:pimeloyl-ACP methyl ester carboxylesterase
MSHSRIQKFYATIPTEQQAYLEEFEQSINLKSIEVGGITWTYYDSEKGGEVFLLIHGGFADFDMWIHQIVAFREGYRVIAPTCPDLVDAKMEDYSKGLYEILSVEGIQTAHVMGYSEGGLVAQCFLQDFPDMVEKIILGHTFYPSPESRYYQYDFKLFRVLPALITELIFKSLAKPDKEELEHDSTEWLEWFKCYFKELKSRLTKAKIITHIDLMMDFVRNYTFTPEDLSDWDGEMLITVSEDDVVLNYFEGMKHLYPYAEYHMFEKGQGAHSIALISPKVFNQRIRAFLER